MAYFIVKRIWSGF